MSTTAITTEPNTNAVDQTAHISDNFTSENYTLLVGYTKDELAKPADERKLKAYPEDAFTSEETDESNKEFKFQVVFSQTFRHYSPSNLTGIDELVPDDDEKLNLVAAQLKVKLVNRSRSMVTGSKFEPVDGVIDFFEQCNQKSERRLTPFEKTKNEILNNMPKEMQAQLLALLQAQLTQPASE